MIKKILVLLSLVFLFSAKTALAFCPVCTVAIAGGLGLSRWLGIDDTISGLWIGALIISMIFWTITYLKSKKINFFGRNILTVVVYYAATLLPLHITKMIGHPAHTLWGIDKLLLGIFIGSLAMLAIAFLYEIMKETNKGHAYFAFQKVVMPIATLLILSGVFYYLTKIR